MHHMVVAYITSFSNCGPMSYDGLRRHLYTERTATQPVWTDVLLESLDMFELILCCGTRFSPATIGRAMLMS